MRLNLDIKDSIYQKLKEEAEAEGRSISDVVRQLVNTWLSAKRVERAFYDGRAYQNGVSPDVDGDVK